MLSTSLFLCFDDLTKGYNKQTMDNYVSQECSSEALFSNDRDFGKVRFIEEKVRSTKKGKTER